MSEPTQRKLPSLLESKSPGYFFAPITYHDTWLSLDPIIGCRLGCRYCYMQQTGWTGVRPERVLELGELLTRLLGSTNRYFRPHETVLCFGNHTDTFLPENVSYFLEFLTELEKRCLTNPLVVVTKKLIPDSVLERASTLHYLRLRFCVSYSGLSPQIEKGVRQGDAIENFKRLRGIRLPAIHFWRPILEENSTDEALTTMLETVVPLAAASVYVGLKVTPQLLTVYEGDPRLRQYVQEEMMFGEHLSERFEQRLREIASTRFPQYPLYRHTSCALSLTLGKPDYNATVYSNRICKQASRCPPHQRLRCESNRTIPDEQAIRATLSHMGLVNEFIVTDSALEVRGEITQEDYTFLLHRFNYPIKASVIRTRNVWGSIFSCSLDLSEKGDT